MVGSKFSYLAFIIAMIVMSYMLGGITTFSNVVLALAYMLGCLSIFSKRIDMVDSKWLFFLLYLPFTIILAWPATIFRSWERLLYFYLMLSVSSPLFQSDFAQSLRKKMLSYILVFCIILSIGSFIGYFLGINFFKLEGNYIDDYVGVAGHFSGLTKQSMFLGPISGISVLFLFNKYFNNKRKYIYILLAIPCAGSLLFASSRGAFLATIFAFIVLVYLNSEYKEAFLKKFIAIILLLMLTFPLWKTATVALQNKQQIHTNKRTEMFDSRTGKVEARLSEFLSSPVWGVGFSAINPHGKDHFNKVTGVVEPGSSWLSVLSMTGMLGFVFFVYLFWISFESVFRITYNPCLLAFLAFFAVHMLVEGYIFAGGNPISFIMWLVIGNSYDSRFYFRSQIENY